MVGDVDAAQLQGGDRTGQLLGTVSQNALGGGNPDIRHGPYNLGGRHSLPPCRVRRPYGYERLSCRAPSRSRRDASPKYRIVDGADDDWASWYADWLINLSKLPDLLGTKPVRSELVYMLVSLDKEFIANAPGGKWEDYYAARLVEHFTSA